MKALRRTPEKALKKALRTAEVLMFGEQNKAGEGKRRETFAKRAR